MNDPTFTHNDAATGWMALAGVGLFGAAHFLAHFVVGLDWLAEKVIHIGSALLVVVALLRVVSHWLHRPHGHASLLTRARHFARLFAEEMKRTGAEA